jgi:hypothetical protein
MNANIGPEPAADTRRDASTVRLRGPAGARLRGRRARCSRGLRAGRGGNRLEAIDVQTLPGSRCS